VATPSARLAAIQAVLLLGGVAVFGRAFQVQVLQHRAWKQKADVLRTTSDTLPARRGTIFDRNGVPLAETQEAYHLTIAKDQWQDSAAVVRELLRLPGVTAAQVAKAMRREHPYFHGEFGPEEVTRLRRMRGVHLEAVRRRVYPLEQLARPLLGLLNDEGRAAGGMERVLDTLLTGTPGLVHYLRDNQSRIVKVPSSILQAPVAGQDVYLTIDYALQGIVEGELRRAVQEHQAKGGDVVVLDVRSGEILAIASLRTDSATGRVVPQIAALVEAYEPGSTAKIFTAAAMLRESADTAPVFGENGRWLIPGTDRVMEDVHPEGGLVTLGQTIKVSSNVAITKFALRLRPEQQYSVLRDFGFGAFPGLGFPGETRGGLGTPSEWDSPISAQPSLATGYYLLTSAVQVAAAYAAIANEGRLMAPSLIREVRDGGSSTTRWRHTPMEVRQAVPTEVATQLMEYLRLATDSGGSGAKAQLDRASVIGKTGTAKVPVNRRYIPGVYRGSFAGIYPGEAPEVVVYVMIDRPSGMAFYGGLVAAPMVRNILQQSLASRTSPLDRATVAAPSAPRRDAPLVVPVSNPLRRIAWPPAPTDRSDTLPATVPVVQGLSVREAILALHRAGFEVRLTGQGTGLARRTVPAAGDVLPRASVVTLYADSLP
jgi:cell division protein FtsI (penicillin-binding protein 3)